MDYQEVYDTGTKEKLSKEFDRLKGVAYLDHTGATLYPEGLIKAISTDLQWNLYGNPHALNSSSKLSSDVVEQTREKVLSYFNTSSKKYHLIFTSGATESLKTLAYCFTWEENQAYAYFAENHTSVIGIREVAAEKGAKIIPLTKSEMNSIFNENSEIGAKGGLFAYPAQCNFSGAKYPLDWIENIHNRGDWSVLLDAASYVATSPLDLSSVSPDFVCISFYKMFGLPTGLGALLVRVGKEKKLKKQYFGGGTVLMAFASGKLWHMPRPTLHESFEDGTVNFLEIAQLRQAMKYFEQLVPKGIHIIEEHTFQLAHYLFTCLRDLKHFNNKPLAVIYQDNNFESMMKQGPIVNFNLRRADDTFIGYSEVLHMCNLFDVHVRTGCFCNPGACQRFLDLNMEELEQQFEAGHVCGDSIDLLGGRPTGSVRASLGYCSTKEDVDKLISLLKKCFLETAERKANLERPLKDLDIGASKEPRLSRLCLYPVKSCGAQEVQSWPLDHKGLVGDRCWMIVTDTSTPLTQKTCTQMCLIKPQLNLEQNDLKLSFPGVPDVKVKFLKGDSTDGSSKVCGVVVQTLDCGDEIAEWLSLALEISGLRLQQQWSDDQRMQKQGAASLSLSNQSQFLLMGLSSLAWLEKQVEEKLAAEGDDLQCSGENLLQRFRSNMIVTGLSSFEEKQWKAIKIGSVVLKSDGPCTRCQMVCIDQSSGEKTVEPLRTIATSGQGKMQFGIYFSQVSIERNKKIFVGSPVKPIEI
ncbi:molybdenum cofactor sulfurase 2 isoform X2 [Neocloeon triangulifer]|uniref:molybdenum cofactor sulfurase 2 isoform X2 n=1 Tax=Neocloeon triangulifer TaxID=2078957 RepID=UPI00286F31A7|nr:molybdenum cofactor sulfurase 2 isoform X2 [Neocloeon triangulifer]